MTLRERPKVTAVTTRQGQGQGQLAAVAAQHGVPEDWLRLVSEGSLEDPAFVHAIRQAAQSGLWKYVNPAVREALVIPTLQIKKLGGTLDDLLAFFVHTHELRNPANQNYFAHTSVLQHVNKSLEWRLKDRWDAAADRGLKNIKSIETAGRVSADKKRKNSRAQKWRDEIDTRKPGVGKEQKYREIEDREVLAPGTVKKAYLRLSKTSK